MPICGAFDERAWGPTLIRGRRFKGMFGGSHNKIVDHSQFGEFPLFLRVARPKHRGVIVDVGVLGKEGSNSYDLLSQLEWRGVLIEANPNVWDQIERDFSGLNSNLVRAAVSDVEGPVEFHSGVVDGVSSII